MSTLMKKAVLWSLVLLLAGAAPAAAGFSQVMVYPDIPGSTDNFVPWGISDDGKISGGYYGEDNTWHGFLFDGPNLTTYDLPGSPYTQGTKISEYGIVGTTRDPNSGIYMGYVYKKGFTTFTVPGSAYTFCSGINDHGQMVGNYNYPDSNTHGFFYDGFGFETLEVLGATDTRAMGINNHEQIVGWCDIPINEQPYHKECGFLYDGTGYTIMERSPGNSNIRGTYPCGINDDGIIVGYYKYGFDPVPTSYGFLFDGQNYLDLYFANHGSMYIYDINNSGRFVGKYYDLDYNKWRIFTAYHAPLPPAVWLFGTGLVGLIGLRGWRRKNQGNS